ncbi:ArsR/SmtB family transcription factor [Nonomuraea wenchangensis]|uniref:ArsR/SmtB family transcription factor n=1 Tax=Nonomuraea wenchangensis TaxID=568860 RepID=UPI00384A52D6
MNAWSETSQPTVSKHLNVLREAGLVEVRKEAQRRWYRRSWRAPYGGCGVIGSTERPWGAQSRDQGLCGPGA